jgi:mRNA interferase HicA
MLRHVASWGDRSPHARHYSPGWLRSQGRRFTVGYTVHNRYVGAVNSGQAKRFLAQRGCTFEPGKGGHLLVRRGERTSILPQHGGRKELGKGLWLKILRDLDIKE